MAVEVVTEDGCFRACLAGLRLLRKRLRLFRWSGFFDGAEDVLRKRLAKQLPLAV
jgi:hypothetical protein